MSTELEFREWLKDLVGTRYATQKEFAEAIGIGQSTVSTWFKGKRMSLRNARDVADHFGVPRVEFMERAEIRPAAIDRQHDQNRQHHRELLNPAALRELSLRERIAYAEELITSIRADLDTNNDRE